MPELDGAACALLAFKGRYIMRGYPTANLGNMLTLPAGRVVVDRTGLAGTWNVELEYTPDQDLANDPATPAGPSLPTAVQEQLGLKLQSAQIISLIRSDFLSSTMLLNRINNLTSEP